MHTSHDACGTSGIHQDASVNHIMLWLNSFLFLVTFWSSHDLRIYNRKIYYEPHPVQPFSSVSFCVGKMLFWLVSGCGCNTASGHWKMIAVPPSGIQVWKTSMPIAHLIYLVHIRVSLCHVPVVLVTATESQRLHIHVIVLSYHFSVSFWLLLCALWFFFPLQNDFLLVTFNHIFPLGSDFCLHL